MIPIHFDIQIDHPLKCFSYSNNYTTKSYMNNTNCAYNLTHNVSIAIFVFFKNEILKYITIKSNLKIIDYVNGDFFLNQGQA